MPHPLPEDVDDVSGLKWFLAAVPDDPAFTRAAWDVFTELANYWKWGMEGPVAGDSDKAAQLWSNAVYETIEVYQMGFPDVLLGYIDDIEDLLQSLQFVSCCATTSVTGDTVTSDITPDVGDPPAEWGDGETVSDWEDWRQLVCGASDTWVTHLKSQVDDIETYLDAGLLLIGVVTALLTAGAGAGILIAIKYSVAVEAFAAILANANNLVFQNIQNGIESARADIRCAIFDGCEDLETVIEGAVGALAWSAWYQFYDWCSIRNSLLEGQFNGGFHAVNRSELCACSFDFDFSHTVDPFVTGGQGYALTGISRVQSGAPDCENAWVWSQQEATDRIDGRPIDLMNDAGYDPGGTPTAFYLLRVEITLCNIQTGGLRLRVVYNGSTDDVQVVDSLGLNTWDPPQAGDFPVNNASGSGPWFRIEETGGANIREIITYWNVEV